MEIRTRDYGLVDIDESSVIRFDDGIIGFEEYHEYALLDESGGRSPFRCLQSLEDSGLAFILMDPFFIKPDYEFTIDGEMATRLSIDVSPEQCGVPPEQCGVSSAACGDIVILTVAVVPEDIAQATFNLKAPIVINANTKVGVQYIVDRNDYGIRHYLAEEIDRAGGAYLREGQAAV